MQKISFVIMINLSGELYGMDAIGLFNTYTTIQDDQEVNVYRADNQTIEEYRLVL